MLKTNLITKIIKISGILLVLQLCNIGSLFPSVTAQAAEAAPEEQLEDLSGIQFPSWMREGEPADRGILSQDQSDKKVVSLLGDSLGTYEGYSTWPNLLLLLLQPIYGRF